MGRGCGSPPPTLYPLKTCKHTDGGVVYICVCVCVCVLYAPHMNNIFFAVCREKSSVLVVVVSIVYELLEI